MACPLVLHPQATTVPFANNARLCRLPAAMATTPVFATSGTCTCPNRLLPHASTVPESVNAREWYRPAAMAAMPPVCASDGTAVWPYSSLPHATTMPTSPVEAEASTVVDCADRIHRRSRKGTMGLTPSLRKVGCVGCFQVSVSWTSLISKILLL